MMIDKYRCGQINSFQQSKADVEIAFHLHPHVRSPKEAPTLAKYAPSIIPTRFSAKQGTNEDHLIANMDRPLKQERTRET